MTTKAYMGESETNHYICGWCPDKHEAEVYAQKLERDRVFLERMKDNIGYRIKTLSHGICTECKEQVLSEHRSLINNN